MKTRPWDLDEVGHSGEGSLCGGGVTRGRSTMAAARAALQPGAVRDWGKGRRRTKKRERQMGRGVFIKKPSGCSMHGDCGTST
jgi:hypothetical protein